MQFIASGIDVNDRGVALLGTNGVTIDLPNKLIDAINQKLEEQRLNRQKTYQLAYEHKDGISYNVGSCVAPDLVAAGKTFKLLYPYLDSNKSSVSLQL